MKIENLIENQNITLEELSSLNEYSKKVLSSLEKYFLKEQKLTDAQHDLLNSILKREFNLKEIEFTKCFLYKEKYYRADYHGDYLCDWNNKLSYNEIPQEQIQDLHARQYNYEAYEDKYVFDGMVAVPNQITNLNYYVDYYKDFEKLYSKLSRAKTAFSKYKIIKTLKAILNQEECKMLVDETLGRNYFKRK